MWIAYGGQARLEKFWLADRRGNKREAGDYSQFIQVHWLAETVALFVTLQLEKEGNLLGSSAPAQIHTWALGEQINHNKEFLLPPKM